MQCPLCKRASLCMMSDYDITEYHCMGCGYDFTIKLKQKQTENIEDD